MHMAGRFGRALSSVHVRLAWEGRSREKYTDLKRRGERERENKNKSEKKKERKAEKSRGSEELVIQPQHDETGACRGERACTFAHIWPETHNRTQTTKSCCALYHRHSGSYCRLD